MSKTQLNTPNQVKVTSTDTDSMRIETPKDFYMSKLRRAEEQVENELQALDVINRAEAIKKIAELMEASSQELITYIDYGEEESERVNK